ncbi:hypothetical protein FA15DRAFT_666750 [Coprinopsis marcescibilis]|uniref:Uncharacterized protein n=1 Tax=Coprinopsis marcescibilis TaxID=230819 RepID=A0A5C3L2Q2_COPMA|nr:hypothetical protein FA15DRAFT_666750 [Coprinopsis marcescibilis]
MKKKVLLGVPGATDGPPASQGSNLLDGAFRSSKGQVQLSNGNNNMDITHGGGIHGISMQRTPLITRNGIPFSAQESQKRTTYNRQQFDFNNIQGLERERSMNVSERSNSVNEIENYLLNPTQSRGPSSTRNFSGNWAQTHQQQPQQNRHISSSTIKRSSGFRPAIGR